jgi:hypothetical protein
MYTSTPVTGGGGAAESDSSAGRFTIPQAFTTQFELARYDSLRLADGATVLPICPVSFRDFMVFEKHAVDAARGMARRFVPPGPVDATRANHDPLQRRIAQDSLTLLFGAAVGGLHRKRHFLGQQRPVCVAGHDGRGEHQAAHARGLAGVDQQPHADHIDLVDLARIALCANLSREMDDAVMSSETLGRRDRRRVGQVANDRYRSWGL